MDIKSNCIRKSGKNWEVVSHPRLRQRRKRVLSRTMVGFLHGACTDPLDMVYLNPHEYPSSFFHVLLFFSGLVSCFYPLKLMLRLTQREHSQTDARRPGHWGRRAVNVTASVSEVKGQGTGPRVSNYVHNCKVQHRVRPNGK
jgi:hypothetical protein